MAKLPKGQDDDVGSTSQDASQMIWRSLLRNLTYAFIAAALIAVIATMIIAVLD